MSIGLVAYSSPRCLVLHVSRRISRRRPCPPGAHKFADLLNTAELPARLTALARVAAVPPPPSPPPPPTKSWWPFRAICFRLSFVDGQCAPAEFSSVQRCNGLIRCSSIGHLHESETARAARLPVRDQGDFFYGAVGLENVAELRFRGAVGQIADIKILHCISSLNKSSKVGAVFLGGRPSKSRGGAGLSCIARERAVQAARTAEILRDASRIPQR